MRVTFSRVLSTAEALDYAAELSEPAPQPSSADTPPLANLPRAVEAPPTSTTPRLAPDAGGRRAVPRAQPGATIAETALELAKVGPFYPGLLAEVTGKPVESCRTALWQLSKQGLLTYTRPPAGRARRESGQYAAAVPVEQLVLPAKPPKRRPSMEPRLARSSEPVADEAAELARYGVRRLPPEQAARVSARAVPGVHRTVDDFFADKPELPPARHVQPRYA